MHNATRELLWEEGELAFVRRRVERGGESDSILELYATSEYPSPATLRRLERERELTSSLTCACTLRSSAVSDSESRLCVVLEDVAGSLLAKHVGRPWPLSDFFKVAIALSAALRELHARGIVHRDLRPRNVLFDLGTARIWLAGLGLATQVAGEAAPEPDPELLGAAAYLAPEQSGRLGRSLDFRSDLYSLGVTLYELLSGKLPFSASTPAEWIQSHLTRMPARLGADVPSVLAEIVARLLAKSPEDRYQSPWSLEADLAACESAWRDHGQIAAFALGSRDREGKLALPRKLFGRADERARLMSAFERVKQSGAPQLVLISGPSGIGKSALARELDGAAVAAGAFFASGKFDQYERNKPYAPLAEALAQLVKRVLGQSDLQLAKFRDALREAVGVNGRLLVDLLPEVEHLIGAQPPVPSVSIEDARNRFQLLIERVLAVFARPEHPLVLFIDDLQWLEEATLELLVHASTRSELAHVLFVLAHRDGQRTPLFERALTQLSQQPQSLQLQLGTLPPDAVRELLTEALGATPQSVEALAALICEKTGGNPFFTTQFLSTLANDAWLNFDPSSSSWTWSEEAIRRRGFTENVVDFMVSKLERLPEDATHVLRWLACLGRSAQPAALTQLSQELTTDVALALEPALRAGLISSGDEGYEFLHDRVQEAVYSRIPEAQRTSQHLQIARWAASAEAGRAPTDSIFQIVDQFRRASALLVEPAERRKVAELNVAAASRARDAAAYGVVLSCLSAAAELLAPDAWQEDYAFKFQLELRRAESLLLIGEPGVEPVLEALSERALGPLDASAITCLRAGHYVARNELARAISVCVDYLAHLDQNVTLHPGEDGVRAEYGRLLENLAQRGVATLVDLPVASDAAWLALVSVFEALLPAAAFSDRDMFDWAALRVVNLSIEHGNSVQSSVAYSHMALTLSSRFGDSALAFQFGEVARKLVERPGFERYHVRVLVVLAYHVLPWTEPLFEALAVMRRTKHEAFEQGDFTYVGFAGVHLVQLGIAAASPLDEVLADAHSELEFVRRAGLAFLADCHASLLGLIEALRGVESPPAPGDPRDGAPPAVPIALFWHWSRRMQTSIFFGNFAEALRCKREAEPLLATSRTHYDFAEFTFFGGLCEALAGELETARTFHEQLARWAERSPATFASRSSLLAAEIAKREGSLLEAQRLFEKAVVEARRSGLLHDEALANELASQFHKASGFHTAARAFHATARHCYARWGATGKLTQLDAESAVGGRAASMLGGQIGSLDVATIVEMSHAISGELDLDRMVARLVELGINHAAATRGLLVLPSPRGLRIAAEARSGAEPPVLLRRSLVTPQELPETILLYVTRTLRPVVLDDASKPSPFAADSYFQQSSVRSLFCLPLVKQGKLAGALYLENALIPSAFTHQRVEVLQLLGSQAAFSLENAGLFANLRRAELALSEAQRLSQTGSFRYGADAGELELSLEAYRIYGFEPGARVSFDAYLGRIHPEDRARIGAEMQHGLQQQQGFRADHRLRLPDGTLKHVRMLAHVATSDGEATSELFGAVMDVTSNKRAEEAEALAKADLAHATRVTTMGELTASLAHELKQPLSAALTNGSTCLRRLGHELPDLEEARAAVTRMVRDVTRASDIVGRIGMLFKKRALPRELVDVSELIRETILILGAEAGRNSVALHAELAPNLPQPLADRVQLQQVLVNLIMNGIDSTKGVGGPHALRVSSLLADGRVVVAVTDSGVGLPAQGADQIFKAFFTTKEHGTGMGLSISRSIVESHGGRLWATPAPERGATFQFTIPVA